MNRVLPPDNHVHSEWSWDAQFGSMEQTCRRAVELGLAAIAFTEHVDHTRWAIRDSDLDEYEHLRKYVTPGGLLTPPPMDVEGYLECIERCRDTFPELRILTGAEVGEPHWHQEAATQLLAAGQFDRILGSLHSLPLGAGYAEPPHLYRHGDRADVMRAYLAEIPRLIQGFDGFGVLAHLDYPVRYWPGGADQFDPRDFEDEYRHALAVLAGSGRALEVNTQLPLHPEIVRWWHEQGGEAVTFGSDAHDPASLARGFVDAAAMVEAIGFRPGRHPHDFWVRSG